MAAEMFLSNIISVRKGTKGEKYKSKTLMVILLTLIFLEHNTYISLPGKFC